MRRCPACGTYIRDTDYAEAVAAGHFEVASYTDPAREDVLRNARTGFFRWLIRLVTANLGRPLAGARRFLHLPITDAHLIDTKYNFSFRGARRLLERTGYEIARVYGHEHGKRGQRPIVWAYYNLTALASALTGLKLTPGLVLICRPARQA